MKPWDSWKFWLAGAVILGALNGSASFRALVIFMWGLCAVKHARDEDGRREGVAEGRKRVYNVIVDVVARRHQETRARP